MLFFNIITFIKYLIFVLKYLEDLTTNGVHSCKLKPLGTTSQEFAQIYRPFSHIETEVFEV